VKGRYPLAALQSLRHRVVDERAREVADRVQRAERAVQSVQAARRARETEQARVAELAGAERQRLETGAARAGDLAHEAAFARAAAERARALAEQEARAAERARAEKAEEGRARGRLAHADADAKFVDQHRDGWQRDAQAKAEADAEEAAGDAWLSRSLEKNRGGGRQ
jgi:dTMP kinase